MPLHNTDCFLTLSSSQVALWQQSSYRDSQLAWTYRVKSLGLAEAFAFDIDPEVNFIAVAYKDGTLSKFDMHTFQQIDKPMQLFPKTVTMKPKSVRIHSSNTFGLVF